MVVVRDEGLVLIVVNVFNSFVLCDMVSKVIVYIYENEIVVVLYLFLEFGWDVFVVCREVVFLCDFNVSFVEDIYFCILF